MNAILSLCMISVLLLSGCGKREYKAVDTKKVAALEVKTDVKLAKTNDAGYLNEEDVTDEAFAFVDDEKEGDVVELAQGETDLAVDEQASVEVAQAENSPFEAVRFELNKDVLKPGQSETLKKDIDLAKKAVEKGKKIVVQGHTCQMGDAGFNLALSMKRAKAIKDEMVKRGLPSDKVDIVGFGSEHTIVSTDATDREQKIEELSPNRRAEIHVS